MANKGSGSRPRPIKQHKLEQGKLYGELALREKMEPTSEKIPSLPSEFTDPEKDAWNFYQGVLEEFGLFNLANAPLLQILAVLHAEAGEFHERLRVMHMYSRVSGSMPDIDEERYYRGIRDSAYRQMTAIYKDLGLSSMGMAKLGSLRAQTKKDDEDTGEFFK